MKLLILNGPDKDKTICLKNGLSLAENSSSTPSLTDSQALVFIDQDMSWKIKGLNNALIRIGSHESGQIKLLPDLVFHLGQTGFKTLSLGYETSLSLLEDQIINQVESYPWKNTSPRLTFFQKPLRLSQVQAPDPLFLTLSYGPREIGFLNPDFHLDDSKLSLNALEIHANLQGKPIVKNNNNQLVLINDQEFKTQEIFQKDRLKIGSFQFEVSFLK